MKFFGNYKFLYIFIYKYIMYHRERILETSTLSCNEEEEDITKPPKEMRARAPIILGALRMGARAPIILGAHPEPTSTHPLSNPLPPPTFHIS